MAESRPIPIVCGPTASGKTGAAVALATRYPVEVVSADSRQIIRHLDIGTAKPTTDEKRQVTFHLIDIVEPGERYSVFRFIDDADAAIDQILRAGHIPVVVGGTGLYLRGLTDGVVEIEEDGGSVIREQLMREMESLGPEEMHRRLARLDPDEAGRIHPNNRVRVIRALEICRLTGRSKTELAACGSYKRSNFVFDWFCLAPPRERLYEIIDARVDAMLADGLLDEYTGLVDRGLKDAVSRANVIGYAELRNFIEGNCTFDEAVASIKQNTRRYAKRQMTWFRHQASGAFFEDRDRLIAALDASLSGWTGIR
ncbi:MAG: tRNA (adenosine(37)-N6)-dimethylallyltransferase MiaA [candidate division Zixibacteria bacterium]|nr:tRNA (adenosine(37)-N6)-dimethylallyltransferase MiaA [candidate division Zixibacteria bacterium]